MLISADLVASSVARHGRIDPEALSRRIGESDRSRFVSEKQRQQRFRALMDQMRDPLAATTILERIIGGNDLVGINYLVIGAQRARAVCRIHLRDALGTTVGFGTGFLVAPGVLMTNHHVIAGAEEARHALAEFDYEYDVTGRDKPVAAFALTVDAAPLSYKPLDFCLAGVAPRSIDGRRSLSEFGWLRLNGTPGKAIIGEYLSILQHPGGERKQACIRENKLLRYDDNGTTLWYKTDTVGGSSGSPVFNQTWQVVALHHSGVPEKDRQGRWLTIDGQVWDSSMDESRIKWIANEGIRISAILEYLRTRRASEALARSVLNPPAEGPNGTSNGHDERLGDGLTSTLEDDELRLTIPVRVAVRIGAEAFARNGNGHGNGHANGHVNGHVNGHGNGNGHAMAVAPIPATGPSTLGTATLPTLVIPSGVEVVRVDQSNYAERPGYDAAFLGDGPLRVPLPKLSAAAAKKRATFKSNGKVQGELQYWNYTVVMHRARRLAFFAAANVDGEQRPSGAGRDGDRWYFDTRIEEGLQVGADFYGRQREFEVDRSRNPFDRGHLVRRLDAQWGSSARVAKRNGDDSFHWTNCAPQHWKFNQGAKRWLGLEDYVIDNFARESGRRACVINGPVFDAPLSQVDHHGRVVPKPRGKRHADPIFGSPEIDEVAIPKLFFKIVVCARPNDTLAAAGFLLSQEDLLATVDRLRGMPGTPEEKLTDAEARLYQAEIADIAHLTGLDFGPLTAADSAAHEGFTAPEPPRLIERFDSIRL